jgi:hypothetical protein
MSHSRPRGTEHIVSDAQVAETDYVAFTGRRTAEHVACRLIVRRVKQIQQRIQQQAELFIVGAEVTVIRCPAEALGPLQRERAQEHRNLPEHLLLTLIEQQVTPFHRGRQRPLPVWRQPVPAASQQREPVIDPVQHLERAKRLRPHRRQLDRQRQPVRPRHQPRPSSTG